jgi:hypothetical protein
MGGFRILAALAAALITITTAAAPASSASPGPTLGTPCDDTNKIVATDTGEMMCTIISTGPAVQQWQLFSRPPLETVVNGSTCGPAGTNGDFRYARSTDSYLVWCVRPSFAPYPIWTLAQP